jgi:multisubunit Na+/H+ antiporter MnhF subunit
MIEKCVTPTSIVKVTTAVTIYTVHCKDKIDIVVQAAATILSISTNTVTSVLAVSQRVKNATVTDMVMSYVPLVFASTVFALRRGSPMEKNVS